MNRSFNCTMDPEDYIGISSNKDGRVNITIVEGIEDTRILLSLDDQQKLASALLKNVKKYKNFKKHCKGDCVVTKDTTLTGRFRTEPEMQYITNSPKSNLFKRHDKIPDLDYTKIEERIVIKEASKYGIPELKIGERVDFKDVDYWQTTSIRNLTHYYKKKLRGEFVMRSTRAPGYEVPKIRRENALYNISVRRIR